MKIAYASGILDLCGYAASKGRGKYDVAIGFIRAAKYTFRSGALRSPLPNADFQDGEERVLYAWGADYAPGNGIMEKDVSRVPSEEEIDRTIEYFAARKLPFIWWSGAKVLESKGFQSGGILTGIAVDITEGMPPTPISSPQLKIKVVATEDDLISFLPTLQLRLLP